MLLNGLWIFLESADRAWSWRVQERVRTLAVPHGPAGMDRHASGHRRARCGLQATPEWGQIAQDWCPETRRASSGAWGGVIRDSRRGFPPGLQLGDRRQSGLGMSGSVPIPNQTPCSDTGATLPWSYARIGDESRSLRHQVRGDLNPGTENPRKQTEREKPRSMLRPIEDPRRSHLASPAVLRGMARG